MASAGLSERLASLGRVSSAGSGWIQAPAPHSNLQLRPAYSQLTRALPPAVASSFSRPALMEPARLVSVRTS